MNDKGIKRLISIIPANRKKTKNYWIISVFIFLFIISLYFLTFFRTNLETQQTIAVSSDNNLLLIKNNLINTTITIINATNQIETPVRDNIKNISFSNE